MTSTMQSCSPFTNLERQPLVRQPLSKASMGQLCLTMVVLILAALWCVLDSWNHEMNSQLFSLSEVTKLSFSHGEIKGQLEPFRYTLTLAFLQFAFMSVVFLSLFGIQVAVAGVPSLLREGTPLLPDVRWLALIGTHIFGSILLQSLMMPSQMMSLGFFAASRAVEVPFAAATRWKVLGVKFGGHPIHTTMIAFVAAWTLFYSYTQIAECMCVWSGFGVALTGPVLYFMYALLIALPPANAAFQESLMMQLGAGPMLTLGLQNLGSFFLFIPVLLAAHCFGFEDVQHAFYMITRHQEVYMTVLWICVQITLLSAVGALLICIVDSFWAVTMRSLRVVYWWARQLSAFYFFSGGMLLSISQPHASLWSLVMLLGIVLACVAVCTDMKVAEEKNPHAVPTESLFERQAIDTKYV